MSAAPKKPTCPVMMIGSQCDDCDGTGWCLGFGTGKPPKEAATPLPGDAGERPENVELLDAIIAYYISRSWPSYQATDWFRDMQFTKAMLEEQSAAIKRHGLRHRSQS